MARQLWQGIKDVREPVMPRRPRLTVNRFLCRRCIPVHPYHRYNATPATICFYRAYNLYIYLFWNLIHWFLFRNCHIYREKGLHFSTNRLE